jgi:ParB/RepB/Spo0J family partition protein
MNTHLEIRYVAVGSLSPNPWNTNRITDPANEEKLRESIRRFGFTKPIVARELPDGRLEILGGEHRWKAAQQLTIEQVPVVSLGLLDDRRAKEIGLIDNGRYGEDDTYGLSQLLAELGKDVLTFMPFTEADLASIAKAAEISLSELDDLDAAALPELEELAAKPTPTSQMVRFKVPLDDAGWLNTLVERVMKTEGFKDEDSLTNAGHALVHLLKKAEVAL